MSRPATLTQSLFHAGGSLTATGRLSSRPEKDKAYSKMSRTEKLARLDCSFASTGSQIPDSDIARMIGRSSRCVIMMRRTADYLRFRTAIQHGLSMDTERSTAETIAYRREYFKNNLPDALRVIADELNRPAITLADRKLKVELARDFLDREGSYPKISRTDSHVKIETDFSQSDSVTAELLAMLDAPIQRESLSNETQRVLNANSAFSNSETLTHDKQSEALAVLEEMNVTTGVQ